MAHVFCILPPRALWRGRLPAPLISPTVIPERPPFYHAHATPRKPAGLWGVFLSARNVPEGTLRSEGAKVRRNREEPPRHQGHQGEADRFNPPSMADGPQPLSSWCPWC